MTGDLTELRLWVFKQCFSAGVAALAGRGLECRALVPALPPGCELVDTDSTKGNCNDAPAGSPGMGFESGIDLAASGGLLGDVVRARGGHPRQ